MRKDLAWGNLELVKERQALLANEVKLNATFKKGDQKWACFAKRTGESNLYLAFDKLNSLPTEKATGAEWTAVCGSSHIPVVSPLPDGLVIWKWSFWNGLMGDDLELVDVMIGKNPNTEQVVFGEISRSKPAGSMK